MKYLSSKILYLDPKIFLVPQFFTQNECNQLIKLANDNLKPAFVSGEIGLVILLHEQLETAGLLAMVMN